MFEFIFGYGFNSYKGVYYAFVAGDLIACIIGIINFVQRYNVYGRLERGEINTVEAGIGEVTGDTLRFTRKGIRISALSEKEK